MAPFVVGNQYAKERKGNTRAPRSIMPQGGIYYDSYYFLVTPDNCLCERRARTQRRQFPWYPHTISELFVSSWHDTRNAVVFRETETDITERRSKTKQEVGGKMNVVDIGLGVYYHLKKDKTD